MTMLLLSEKRWK